MGRSKSARRSRADDLEEEVKEGESIGTTYGR